MSCRLWKTPLYTHERMRVKKANSMLVLLWKVFGPRRPSGSILGRPRGGMKWWYVENRCSRLRHAPWYASYLFLCLHPLLACELQQRQSCLIHFCFPGVSRYAKSLVGLMVERTKNGWRKPFVVLGFFLLPLKVCRSLEFLKFEESWEMCCLWEKSQLVQAAVDSGWETQEEKPSDLHSHCLVWLLPPLVSCRLWFLRSLSGHRSTYRIYSICCKVQEGFFAGPGTARIN